MKRKENYCDGIIDTEVVLKQKVITEKAPNKKLALSAHCRLKVLSYSSR